MLKRKKPTTMTRLHDLFKLGLPLLAALCCATSVQAFPDITLRRDFVRTIDKSFPLDATGEVALDNRYGSIDVIPWDKEEVAIQVRIEVKADDEAEANEIFDRINISFSNSSTYVSATTEIGTDDKSWWDRLWEWDWSWGNSGNDFKIRYRVQMPRQAALDLDMSYGNANVRPIAGKVAADIAYGDLRLDGVDNSAEVEVSYGKATIGKVRDRLDVEVRYSELNVDEAGDTELDTRYSEIRLTRVGDLRIDSRYDDYWVERARRIDVDGGYSDFRFTEVGGLTAESNYSDYRLQRVSGRIDIDTDYGDVEIESVSTGFTEVRIRGAYSDCDLRLDAGVGYDLDAKVSYGDISYPGNLNTSLVDNEGTSEEVRGSANGGGSPIEVRLSYGDLRLRQ
jgi:hypothetical protein